MNYENWISARYMTASKGGFLKFLNIVSIAGVAVGVMALIVVTGVMTGFGNNLREKIIGATPHIVVEKETGIRGYDKVIGKLLTLEEISGASAYIQGNVFHENQGQAVGQVLRGIDPKNEPFVTKIKEYLTKGDLQALEDDGILIGAEMARYFNYHIGDELTLIAPGSGLSGKNWRYKLKVAGIFQTGMVDFDTNLVIVGLSKAQEIFDLPADQVTGIGLKIQDPTQAQAVKEKIYQTLDYSYLVKTWIDMNHNLFDALFLEKWGLFLILTLMVLVASFNIISTLIVTVMSKTHDIGILQSYGVPQKSIRAIFTKQGVLIGMLGIFWGVVLGLGISYLLKTYVKVPAAIYSVDTVPVEIQMTDLLVIIGCALLISFLASLYPAGRAARLKPVDALRYE